MSAPDAARPAHRMPRLVAVVAIGGALGATARAGVTQLIGGSAATFAVNVTGAFFLGALLETLTRSGPDVGRRRDVRLLVGTGFCGAFTTYSTFAHDVATAFDADGVAYGGVSSALFGALIQIVCGLLAAALGAWVGTLAARRQGMP